MPARTYVPSLLEAATRLCKLITVATPVIVVLYPTNTDLQNALSAANSACSTLREELAKVRAYGD